MSARIAEGIEENYSSLGLGKRQFPSFRAPDEKSSEDYLQELCERGLRDRYGDPPPPAAQERMDHELAVINRMGFASYFLIVWDFVRYAHERGIPASARVGLRRAGQLCLAPQQRLPAQVRPAVRAVPRPQSVRGAGYRYRPLPGAALRGDRLRPQEVRRRQRGPDWHLWHDEGQGGHQGRGPGPQHSAGRVEQINRLIPTRLNITLDEALKEEKDLRKLVEEDAEIERLIRFAKRLEGSAPMPARTPRAW